MLDRLTDDHIAILGVANELSLRVSAPVVTDLEGLTRCRWRLRRILMLHLALEDKHIYGRMDDDADLIAVAPPPHVRAELMAVIDGYVAHCELWTIEAARLDWAGYRAAVDTLLELLRKRIDWEDNHLYPALRLAYSEKRAAA